MGTLESSREPVNAYVDEGRGLFVILFFMPFLLGMALIQLNSYLFDFVSDYAYEFAIPLGIISAIAMFRKMRSKGYRLIVRGHDVPVTTFRAVVTSIFVCPLAMVFWGWLITVSFGDLIAFQSGHLRNSVTQVLFVSGVRGCRMNVVYYDDLVGRNLHFCANAKRGSIVVGDSISVKSKVTSWGIQVLSTNVIGKGN